VHNPKLLKTARRLLPNWLRVRLDPFHARIERALAHFADELPAGARVLDCGAGECQYRDLFRRARYVAVDSAVGDAAWDYSQLSAIGDLGALPFADATFDAAISTVTLEHVRFPAAALAEMRRVLRYPGQVFLAVPQFWELHQAPHDYFRYTRCGTEYLLRQAGFEVERLEPTGGYFQVAGKLSIDLLQFVQIGWRRVIWVLLAPVFGFAIPLACYYLDKLDRKRNFTIGWIAVARTRPETPAPSRPRKDAAPTEALSGVRP
jgi:SAM-dependent methyltransferase